MLLSPDHVRILGAVRTRFILLVLVGLIGGSLLASGVTLASMDERSAVELSLVCQTDATEAADNECCDNCGHVCCLPGAAATVNSVVTIAATPLILTPPTALRERPVPVLLEPPRPTHLR